MLREGVPAVNVVFTPELEQRQGQMGRSVLEAAVQSALDVPPDIVEADLSTARGAASTSSRADKPSARQFSMEPAVSESPRG